LPEKQRQGRLPAELRESAKIFSQIFAWLEVLGVPPERFCTPDHLLKACGGAAGPTAGVMPLRDQLRHAAAAACGGQSIRAAHRG